MDSSKQKPTMADVTKPPKTAKVKNGPGGPAADNHRIIGHTASNIPLDDVPEARHAASREPLLAPSKKRTVIVPIDATADDQPPKLDAPDASIQALSPEPGTSADTDTNATPLATDADSDTPPATADTDPEMATEPDDTATLATDGPKKPSTQTQKAVQEAAKAIEREHELEEFINSRQYNVPINSAVRKRSIKASMGMTFFVLILGIVLIDLMLDTGMILLIQKIPHTHFFAT